VKDICEGIAIGLFTYLLFRLFCRPTVAVQKSPDVREPLPYVNLLTAGQARSIGEWY